VPQLVRLHHWYVSRFGQRLTETHPHPPLSPSPHHITHHNFNPANEPEARMRADPPDPLNQLLSQSLGARISNPTQHHYYFHAYANIKSRRCCWPAPGKQRPHRPDQTIAHMEGSSSNTALTSSPGRLLPMRPHCVCKAYS
jgi:hypothetical protein